MAEKLLAKCCEEIKAEYEKIGHTQGSRFLLGPATTFSQHTRIICLELHPGGAEIVNDNLVPQGGSAFYTESWNKQEKGKHPLQIQMQRMFNTLHKELSISGSTQKFVEENILTAYFVPFRATSTTNMHNKTKSFNFAKKMWGEILSFIKPEVIICMGRDVYNPITTYVMPQNGFKMRSEEIPPFPSGWGKYTLNMKKITINNRVVSIGRMLQLSRFKLFGRPESDKATSIFFKELCKDCTSTNA